MIATNHALTGAVIGLTLGKPWMAVPTALLSHYVCDMLPHYHSPQPDAVLLKSKGFRNYLLAEAGLCTTIVVILALAQPDHWFLAAVCAFIAAAPDLLSINRYLKERQGRPWKPGWYTGFAKRIQWFERPIGVVVETAWFIGSCTLFGTLLLQ